MLPLRARVDLETMVIMGYSAFPKAPVLLEPHHQIVQCHIQDTHWAGSYPSAEKQLVYSTAPADWANAIMDLFHPSLTESSEKKLFLLFNQTCLNEGLV